LLVIVTALAEQALLQQVHVPFGRAKYQEPRSAVPVRVVITEDSAGKPVVTIVPDNRPMIDPATINPSVFYPRRVQHP
jgi:hypothetical protein